MTLRQPDQFAKRLIELYGGRERCLRALSEHLSAFDSAWVQNTDVIGRVLRGHLVVEHFLTSYLASANPRLGSLRRLSFSQKLDLVGDSDPFIAALIPGIRRLNEIRNRFAHDLSSEVTAADATLFLSVPPFRSLRDALAEPDHPPSTEALPILEDFARYVGAWLQGGSSNDRELWERALWEELDSSTGEAL